jgi:hypothetical protein
VIFAVNEMMIGTDVHRRAVLKRVDVKIHKHIIKFAYPLRNSWLQTSHRWKERLSLNFFSIEKIQTLGLIHIARTKRIRYTRRTVVAQRWNPVEAKQKKKRVFSGLYMNFSLFWDVVQCYVAVCDGRLGRECQCHLQGYTGRWDRHSIPKMSARNSQLMLPNISE